MCSTLTCESSRPILRPAVEWGSDVRGRGRRLYPRLGRLRLLVSSFETLLAFLASRYLKAQPLEPAAPRSAPAGPRSASVKRRVGRRLAKRPRLARPPASPKRKPSASERNGSVRAGAAAPRYAGRSLRALARLLASGSTRRAAARALGVDERTIRRWTKLPGFAAELEKARERRERELERAKERERKRRERNAWRRFARLNPEAWAEARNPDRRPELRPEPKPVADPGPKRGKLLRPIQFQ